MQNRSYFAFTRKEKYPVRQLITKVGVNKADTEIDNNTQYYNALWDTGATNSVITINVINDLNLQAIRYIPVNHAGGQSLSGEYPITIHLQKSNGDFVSFPKVYATYMEITSDSNNPIDVLIGMDIIGCSDLAITNNNNETVMSFMYPSHENINFEPTAEKLNVQRLATENKDEF